MTTEFSPWKLVINPIPESNNRIGQMTRFGQCKPVIDPIQEPSSMVNIVATIGTTDRGDNRDGAAPVGVICFLAVFENE
jgi:hypothetical protein